MSSKPFHLGAILTVTTDIVMTSSIDDVLQLLSHMASEPIAIQQVPRVADEAKPVILRQHPALAELDPTRVPSSAILAWLAEQVKRFGETLPIAPMTADEHERVDAVQELAEKLPPGARVHVVR